LRRRGKRFLAPASSPGSGAACVPPIRIKLSGPVGDERVVEVAIDGEEELPGAGSAASSVDGGPGVEASGESSDGGGETGGGVAGDGKRTGELADQLSGADEAAVGTAPAADQEEPVVDEHGEALGDALAAPTPGLLALGGGQGSMPLPALEQPRDLPPCAGEDEGVLGGQQGWGDGGDQDRPVGPSQSARASRAWLTVLPRRWASAFSLRRRVALTSGGRRTASNRAGRCWSPPSVTGWSLVVAGVVAC
jgi:hypothetical protein